MLIMCIYKPVTTVWLHEMCASECQWNVRSCTDTYRLSIVISTVGVLQALLLLPNLHCKTFSNISRTSSTHFLMV